MSRSTAFDRLASTLFAAIAAGGACIGTAQAADPFSGKSLKVVVGMPPGGGVDAYARLIQRHLVRHLPGKPSLVVQHMPGAGSLRAVQFMATVPDDATTIVTFTSTLLVDSLLSPGQTKVDFRDFRFIGNVSEDTRVCYIRQSYGPGSMAELMKGKEFVFAATTASLPEALMVRNLFGLNMRVVRGYAGSADKRLALEKGEADADCGGWTSLPTDWRAGRVVNTFVRVSPALLPGMDKSVPFGGDLLRSDEDRRIYDFLTAYTRIGRPFMVKRGVPADQLQALRSAFDAAMADPELLAEAAKMDMTVMPIAGAEVDRQIAQMYANPPELLARARALTSDGGK
jgi:tripartite-type tricarboxylate transporter receptor subunit TctC